MKTMKTRAASLAALPLLAGMVAAAAAAADEAPCAARDFEGQSYTVCTAHADDDLRLFLKDGQGALIGTPERLEALLAPDMRLVFAMNAGMYHADREPVGLFVEDGQQGRAIVTAEGPGNFGLLPNGVFCIGKTLRVIESRAFAADPPACRHATQSGPMLVIGGALHPRFLPDSDSRNIRNGVGVSEDGQTAWFAISEAPVTFHEFARLFRDGLGAPDALYLDGKVSRLTVPAQGRSDFGLPMGPIVGLVTPAAPAAD